tara:strand:+ start:292 stop:1437 length:1146 start_codon:yes stop_codon:yes gene_type:complete
MKKVFYWSPHISKVATIKNVINSAFSLKKFCKGKIEVSIVDVIGEWDNYKNEFHFKGINFKKISGLQISKFLPISGFIKSRIIYLIVFLTKTLKLKKLLDENKPEYFIVHLITIVPLILLVLFKFDTKFILRISGLPKLNLFRTFLWKKISNKIYMVTCPSEQTKKNLLDANIFPKEKVIVIYDPILEVQNIKKKISENNDAIKGKKNYFLNIGRLTRQKNQVLLVDTFSNLVRDNQNIFLYIVGDGEQKEILKKKIINSNLQENIFLLGHCDNIFPLIKNSMAVVSTSLWEDPGAVMIEAAFCNKIVISSNCPNGPEEFLENGKGGYLFQNNDPMELEAKIKIFLSDNNDLKLKKIVNSKKKSKNYSLFRHYQKLSKILI